ncbi:MAG TPA: nucleoside 2-deoxyribosyltransferase [Patescibacteria group bacterium]
MKTYFVASISGRKKYLTQYQQIVRVLNKLGHEVTEDTLRPSHDEVYNLTDDQKVDFYKQVLKWIANCDLMIAEVSHPSLGVGHEISLALERGKPVIILYTDGNTPHFLEGLDSEKIIIEKYDSESLEKILVDAIDFAKDQSDTRFNFFISPRHVSYLDWIAKTRRLPRSVYLRDLIKADMEENQEYQS